MMRRNYRSVGAPIRRPRIAMGKEIACFFAKNWVAFAVRWATVANASVVRGTRNEGMVCACRWVSRRL
jgi:hypothetical protein